MFLSGLWSENKEFWLFSIQKYSAFLIFPIYFSFLNVETNKILTLKKSYLWASLIIILFHLILLIIKILQHKVLQFKDISYANFTIFGHPSYVAFYWILAIIFAFDLYQKKLISKNILIFSVILISIAVFLSMSRIAIVFLILFLGINFYKVLKIPILYLLIFGFYGIVALLNTERFSSLPHDILNFKKDIQQPDRIIYSNELRILTWKATAILIKQNPLLGVGSGDIKDELIKIYKQKNYRFPLHKKLNTHNQFLQSFAEGGFLAFIFLVVMIFYPIYLGIKHKDFSVFWFFAGWLMFLSVESMLEREAGILFFCFFGCLLLNQLYKNQKNSYLYAQK